MVTHATSAYGIAGWTEKATAASAAAAGRPVSRHANAPASIAAAAKRARLSAWYASALRPNAEKRAA